MRGTSISINSKMERSDHSIIFQLIIVSVVKVPFLYQWPPYHTIISCDTVYKHRSIIHKGAGSETIPYIWHATFLSWSGLCYGTCMSCTTSLCHRFHFDAGFILIGHSKASRMGPYTGWILYHCKYECVWFPPELVFLLLYGVWKLFLTEKYL